MFVFLFCSARSVCSATKQLITIFDECPPRVSKNFTLCLRWPHGRGERRSENQRVDVFGLNIAREIND